MIHFFYFLDGVQPLIYYNKTNLGDYEDINAYTSYDYDYTQSIPSTQQDLDYGSAVINGQASVPYGSPVERDQVSVHYDNLADYTEYMQRPPSLRHESPVSLNLYQCLTVTRHTLLEKKKKTLS